MKKFILILALVILFTGCDIKDVTDKDIEDVINKTLELKVRGTNNNFKGYKFYIPQGLIIQNKKGNNYVLLSNGDYYYMYVDIVSYFHKKEVNTTFDENLFFSKQISYNDINGYVKKENIELALMNSIRVLASIKYNDIILDSMIGEKTQSYEEEIYNFFESKREDGNFLDYVEEYDPYEKKEVIKDEDIITSIDE